MNASLRSAITAIAAALLGSVPTLAQAPAPHGSPPPPPVTSAPAVAERTLTLDVAVTTKNGKLVPGLTEHDFAVLDNGHSSPILSFAAVAPPAALAEIVLVVDAINTNYSSVAYERDQIKQMLEKTPEPLAPTSIALVTDTKSSVQVGPTTDHKQLLDGLAKLDVQLRFLRRSSGFYGAAERFDLSLRAISGLVAEESTHPGRKLVLWVSPGWPLLTGPDIQLSRKDQDGFFREIVALSGAMRAARLTLYSIDPLGTADAGGFRTFYYESFLKPIKRPQDVQIADLSLQVLASETGGLVLNSSNDVAGELERCSEDARSFYTLTITAAPAEHSDDFHQLAVKVEDTGLTVRTRNGYYAQP